MEAYTGFAELYDLFMDDVPYAEWVSFLKETLAAQGITEGILCELGCGTGKITRALADCGYDMIGIDRSPEMLEVAQEQETGERTLPILYLMQDIRAFELYGTVRAVIAVCDTINYLLEKEDLVTTFSLVNNYLDPGGIFVFQLNLPAYYAQIGDATIAENREDASFIWENAYTPVTGRNLYEMTFFSREEDGRFVRFEETHEQQAYTLEEVKDALSKAGLQFVSASEIGEGETLWIIAREHGK